MWRDRGAAGPHDGGDRAADGIAKPLIYNTTRAGVAHAELDRVTLPGRQHGFRMAQEAGDRATAAE